MHVQPYLFFDGRSEEALEFYREALGAEVTALMRFKEAPQKSSEEGDANPEGYDSMPPGAEDKVMHSSFRIGDTTILASDGLCGGNPSFTGFSLTLHASDESEADRLFDALAKDGQILAPMAATFYSPRFGMVADRFGVSWMIIVDK